jgi:sortase A
MIARYPRPHRPDPTDSVAPVVDETATGRPARQRRPNRFDRPPEPHDWRWFIGGIGRTLIATGVLLFAFVAYQLWGTGIQTARAQGQLEREFDDLLAASPTAAPTTVPPAVATTVPASTTPPATGDATSTTAPPTTTAAPLSAAVAPRTGEVLARLEIPGIGLDKIVVEGVSPDDLKKGPGHFPETPLPGQFGNAAIAGHRTTYGEPFIDIDQIQIGDEMLVTAPWGRFIYVVDNIIIVGADDYALVIPTVDPTLARITLASCHPKYSAKQRYVVQATLDTARSDQATFPSLTAPPEPAVASTTAPPTVPPVGPGTTSAPTVPTVAPETTSAPTVPVSTSSTAVPGGLGPDEGSNDDSGAVVFGSKWFSDDDAYVPVAMWGFRLIVVAFVATAISRFARRNLVGVLVGIVPFVVCLYFFFEDLSRLLPANL